MVQISPYKNFKIQKNKNTHQLYKIFLNNLHKYNPSLSKLKTNKQTNYSIDQTIKLSHFMYISIYNSTNPK